MVLIKWTSDTTSKFIALYKQQECLWKTDSLAYRDKDARNASLNKIIKGMMLPHLTPDEVKKKIKYLRSTYMVEVNKIQKSKRSGAGTGSIYKPALSWFREMDSFIKYIKVRRHKHGTLVREIENSNTDNSQGILQTELDNIEPANRQIETSREQPDRQVEKDRGQAFQQTEPSREQELDKIKIAEEQTFQQVSLRREQTKRLRGVGRRIKSGGVKRSRIYDLNSVVEGMKLINDNLNKEDTVNEFDIFGKSVGLQLKALLEEDAVMAQEEIQSILTRYRLKKIRSKFENSYISNTVPHYYEIQRSQSRQSNVSDGSGRSRYSEAEYNIIDETKDNVQQLLPENVN